MITAKNQIDSAERILILTGAGVSAESGVPTFRGVDKWKGMPFHELSSARMVSEDLPLVWEWFDYRRAVIAECKPNPAHNAIADLHKSTRFKDVFLVTQNIDGLHRAAGSDNFIELHGQIGTARCLSCSALTPLDSIAADERPPVCPECGDSMRPHVVLFGEGVDEDDLLTAYEKAAACDVCIVVGTSAVVYPANMIPKIAKREGAYLIEVNLEETELTELADVSLFGKAGEIVPKLFE